MNFGIKTKKEVIVLKSLLKTSVQLIIKITDNKEAVEREIYHNQIIYQTAINSPQVVHPKLFYDLPKGLQENKMMK